VQHAPDLDHDLGHLDGATEQVDAIAAQPGQFPDAQPEALTGHHDRGSHQLRRQPHQPARGPLHRGGIARARFRVAVSGRRDQEASFFTVVVWRDQAKHAAESLSKGSRVVVVGRLQQRSWTAEDGSARSVVEVVAEELGASLR
jgi:Single-strand binding protein family